jgi:hypothetical protein
MGDVSTRALSHSQPMVRHPGRHSTRTVALSRRPLRWHLAAHGGGGAAGVFPRRRDVAGGATIALGCSRRLWLRAERLGFAVLRVCSGPAGYRTHSVGTSTTTIVVARTAHSSRNSDHRRPVAAVSSSCHRPAGCAGAQRFSGDSS